MAKRQLAAPKSKIAAEIPITRYDESFGKLYMDIPSAKAPKGSLTILENAISYPHEIVGRRGTYKYSTLTIPTYATTITASKSGTTITKTAGSDFTSAMGYGMYFVWADGTHDEIVAYVSTTQLTTRNSGTRASTAACSIRQAGYGSHYHVKSRKILCQFGTKLYWTDYTFAAYTEVMPQTPTTMVLEAAKSHFYDFDDNYVVCINNSGLMKVYVGDDKPYYFRMNTPCPTTKITGVVENDDRHYGRRYIYSMSKMKGGVYTGDRIGNPADTTLASPTLTIEQESGTTKFDKDYIDYGEVFTEKPVGTGTETYGLVIGGYGPSGAATGINKDIELWRTLSASGFSIDLNDLGPQDIFCDFSVVDTLNDVCWTIQNALRVYVPSATCEIDVNTATGYARFLISTGKYNGSTVTVQGTDPIASPLTTGLTDISGYESVSGCGLLCDFSSGGVIATASTTPSYYYTAPSEVGTLVPALIPHSASVADTKWTHYSIYGPKDSGPNGTSPNTGIGNDPELFIWIADIPVAKAMRGTQSAGGILTITTALSSTVPSVYFRQSDVGSTITWTGGTQDEITYLCDAGGNAVTTESSRYAKTDGTTVAASTSFAIGSLRVGNLTKVGTTVTSQSGITFSATDVGKPIYWSDGDITWITAYIGASSVTVRESGSKGDATAATYLGGCIYAGTSGRRFNDTITDEILDSRIKNFYIAEHRLWEALPDNVNIGCMVPGFLVVGKRDDQKIYFSQARAGREYRCGYYYSPSQYDNRCKDGIQSIEKDPDTLTVRCANSTYTANTSDPISEKDERAGTTLSLIRPLNVLDGTLGCVNTRTIKEIGIGQKLLLASDYTLRMWTPSGYSDSLSRYQVENILKKCATASCAHYDETTGYVVWMAETQ